MVARSWRVPPRGTRRFFEGGFAGFLSEAPPAPPTRRAPPFLPEEMGGKRGRGAFRLFKKEASHGFSSKAPPAPSTPAPQYGGSWRRQDVRAGQRPGWHCRPLRRHKLRIARFAASGKARSLHCALTPVAALRFPGQTGPPIAPLLFPGSLYPPLAALRRETLPTEPASLGFGGGPVMIISPGAAAPWVARIGITPQALMTAALYRPGTPGRRRCHASEIPGQSRRLSVGRDDSARRPQGRT